MVDAHTARVTQQTAQHVAQRGIAELGQPARMPRRHTPVLPLLVERVRWRADARAECERVLQSPGVGAGRVGADGEVVYDADGQPGGTSARLHGVELVVTAQLQPGVEANAVRKLRLRPLHGCAVRPTQVVGPPAPVRPVHLGQRAPGGPVQERSVEAADVRAARRAIQKSQRRRLRGPHLVAVYPVAVVSDSQRVDLRAHLRGRVGVLLRVLDPQVERVGPAPAGRVVGRVLQGRDRRCRVQGVDEDEAPALLRGPGGDSAEVVQVTDPP